MTGQKMFAFLLLICLCNIGNADECALSDLAVTQAIVPGNVAAGHPEYAVVVENRCFCTQAEVKLSCRGFSSSMGVDPDVLRPDGDGKFCTLNDGWPIGSGPSHAVKFRYASSSQIRFRPMSSTIACS